MATKTPFHKLSYGQRPRHSRDFVYIATDGYRLKIGRTWHLRLRMVQLSRSAGAPMSLYAYIPHPDKWSAMKQEVEFHNAASGKWRGDWHPIDVETINRFLTSARAVICL